MASSSGGQVHFLQKKAALTLAGPGVGEQIGCRGKEPLLRDEQATTETRGFRSSGALRFLEQLEPPLDCRCPILNLEIPQRRRLCESSRM